MFILFFLKEKQLISDGLISACDLQHTHILNTHYIDLCAYTLVELISAAH